MDIPFEMISPLKAPSKNKKLHSLLLINEKDSAEEIFNTQAHKSCIFTQEPPQLQKQSNYSRPFDIYVKLQEKYLPKRFTIQIQEKNSTCEKVILEAVEAVNKYLNKKGCMFQFKDISIYYELMPANKYGNPKKMYSPFNFKENLWGIERLYLDFKEDSIIRKKVSINISSGDKLDSFLTQDSDLALQQSKDFKFLSDIFISGQKTTGVFSNKNITQDNDVGMLSSESYLMYPNQQQFNFNTEKNNQNQNQNAQNQNQQQQQNINFNTNHQMETSVNTDKNNKLQQNQYYQDAIQINKKMQINTMSTISSVNESSVKSQVKQNKKQGFFSNFFCCNTTTTM